MKKILMISCRLPSPEYKGGYNRRVLNFAKILSKKYYLDLVTTIDSFEEKEMINELKNANIFKNIFYFYNPKVNEYKNSFLALFSRFPLQTKYYFSKKMRNWILKNYQKYNLLYFNLIRTGLYSKNLLKVPKIIDLIDSISSHYKTAKEQTRNIFWKKIYQIEINRLEAYERKIIEGKFFDKYFISSNNDKRTIEKLLKREVKELIVIPNGVNEGLFKKHNGKIRKEEAIAFFGKMDYQPNIDAVCWFGKEVFPFLKEKYPNLKFYIIGINPSFRVKRLKKIKGIKITGYIKDIHNFLRKMKLIVVPLRFGAGLQNKVLEAMALGLPVVSSEIGARGIDGLINGKHIEVIKENNPLMWQKKILEMLSKNNLEKNLKMEKEAQVFIKENYSWEKIERKLLTEVEKII